MGGVEEGKGQKTEKRETMLTKTKKVPIEMRQAKEKTRKK